MSDIVNLSIEIPTDNDGYILLQCEHCGEFFKLTSSDIESDEILTISCPACGLKSETYMTEDVINLALAKIINYANDMIFNAFDDMRRRVNCKNIKVTCNKPEHVAENPIISGIDALEITTFTCCNKTAKVKPLLKFTGCYCPCCGVKNYEVK